jgi:hypothetical protein
MDAFCALNAPAPLLSILEADIVLAVRLPRKILITSEVGVMNRIYTTPGWKDERWWFGYGRWCCSRGEKLDAGLFSCCWLRELALPFQTSGARDGPDAAHVGQAAF